MEDVLKLVCHTLSRRLLQCLGVYRRSARMLPRGQIEFGLRNQRVELRLGVRIEHDAAHILGSIALTYRG